MLVAEAGEYRRRFGQHGRILAVPLQQCDKELCRVAVVLRFETRDGGDADGDLITAQFSFYGIVELVPATEVGLAGYGDGDAEPNEKTDAQERVVRVLHDPPVSGSLRGSSNFVFGLAVGR